MQCSPCKTLEDDATNGFALGAPALQNSTFTRTDNKAINLLSFLLFLLPSSHFHPFFLPSIQLPSFLTTTLHPSLLSFCLLPYFLPSSKLISSFPHSTSCFLFLLPTCFLSFYPHPISFLPHLPLTHFFIPFILIPTFLPSLLPTYPPFFPRSSLPSSWVKPFNSSIMLPQHWRCKTDSIDQNWQ